MVVFYTPGASTNEVLDAFEVAARYGASLHLHMRDVKSDAVLSDIQEAIADATLSSAPLLIVHLNSTAQEMTPTYLDLIRRARSSS